MADILTLVQPEPTPLGPGSELGSYRIVDRVGEGGMGQVFRAEHLQLGRRVALKVLNPELSGNREVVRRFFQEAQLINRISHEHIVDVSDFGHDPRGHVYCVMEFLEGGDLLAVRRKQGPYTLARMLKIAREAGDALTAAHQKKVIHRDLKPENIFLTQRHDDPDFVKLLDFGIAKLLETDGKAGTMGLILGTPQYMSPEQAAGGKIDWRSDIYSFGLVLYWMLSDRLPYTGETYGELLVERQTKAAPALPETTASGEPVPKALAAAVMDCLERDPNKRVQSIAELLLRLGPAPAGSGPKRAAGSGRTAKLLVVIPAAALLIAAGVWAFRSRPRFDPKEKIALPEPAAVTPPAELPPPDLPPPEAAASPPALPPVPVAKKVERPARPAHPQRWTSPPYPVAYPPPNPPAVAKPPSELLNPYHHGPP